MGIVRILIEFAVAFLSTMGFGLISNIPKRVIPSACLTGACGWLVYYLLRGDGTNIVLSNFFAALTIGLLGNYFSVIIKAPINMIYIPSLVSLVPGSIIYLGMKNFTTGNPTSASYDLLNVVEIGLALAVGFVSAEVVFNLVKKTFIKKMKKIKE